MTIELDIFRREGVDNTDKNEQARRAVKAFRALQPTLSAYARMLTKRSNVRVEMAARDNGSTDGNKIYFRPPMELGNPTPHERRLCDKRDEFHQPCCPACAVRERVLVTIYHEIAHICYDSFLEPSKKDQKEAIERAVAEAPGKYAEKIRQAIENAPFQRKNTYLKLASLISPYLPTLVNALDDARVNRELFKARKGTKVMFEADEWRTFTQGFEASDGMGGVKTVKWNEQPADMQIIVGMFCKGVGHDYRGWFHPDIVEALNDAELTALVRRLDTVRSMAGVYELSFPVLVRLRELGFLRLPQDPDMEQEQGDEGEPSDESGEGNESGEEGEGEGEGPSSPDAEGSESASGDDPEPGAPEGSGGMESDEGQPDSSGQATEEAVDEDTGSSDTESDRGGGTPEDSDDSGSSTDSEDQSGEGDDQGTSPSSGNPDREESESSSGDSSDGDSSNESDGTGSEAEGGVDEQADADEGDSDTDSDAPSSEGSDSSESDSEAGGDEADSSDGGSDASSDNGDLDSGKSDSEASDRDGEGSEPDSTASDDGSVHAGSEDATGAEQRGADPSDDLGRRPADADVEGPEEGSLESRPEPDEPDAADGPDLPDEAIESGADDGTGGVLVIENEENDHLPPADPEQVQAAVMQWLDHDDKPKSVEEQNNEAAVDRAIIQGIYFETPSRNVYSVREHRFGEPQIISGYNMSGAWDDSSVNIYGFTRRQLGIEGDFETAESILGPALLKMRTVFSDNKRGAHLRHRKSGRVDARVLGKRAGLGDPRLFKKKIVPGKKSYFVLIGVDVSGSTVGTNIVLEKKAVMAQATLLSRMGIPFAIYAHSGNLHDPTRGRAEGLDLEIYIIKEAHEPWDPKTHQRLQELGPDSANLDGHSLEYYRKRLDEVQATDKILLYYTDGKMPAENYDEELEVLQREIRTCRNKGYTLLGVGIRTDSPIRHGLDTVEVNEDADVVKVVQHLEKRLIAR